MLLKFFTNSAATAYLREMAEEFDESTNSVRHELNNLSKAGYLTSHEDGRTIKYRANTQHPLYHEVKNLVHKFLGIDKIIDQILSRLGNLEAAYIIGDYARGKDTGTIELVLVGEVNQAYLNKLILKAKDLLHRNVKAEIIDRVQYQAHTARLENALLIWGN
jgi:predicted transcriptional regulator